MAPHRWLRLRWIVMLGAAAVVCIAYPVWLAALGGFLVHTDPPDRADIIVVLAGDWRGNRVLKGAELVKEGLAPKALISGPRHHYGLREFELAIPFAERHGYSRETLEGFPLEATSTREEVRQIAAELRRRGVHRVIVVTSDYHTRRAGRIWRSLAPGLDVRMVASPDPFFKPKGWWNTREGRKTFLLEWTKTIASVAGM